MGTALLLAVTSCDEVEGQRQAGGATPPLAPTVGVALVETRDVAPSVTFNGRVEAVDKVDLQARIAGFLLERRFEEGQEVGAANLLFVIKKQQYEAGVQEARAGVAQAQAVLSDAELQLARGQELVRNRNIPRSEVDARRARRDDAQAKLLAAEAGLRQAEINLGYTDVKAPVGPARSAPAPSPRAASSAPTAGRWPRS